MPLFFSDANSKLGHHYCVLKTKNLYNNNNISVQLVNFCLQITYMYVVKIECRYSAKSIIIICASETDYETGFKRFVLLFDKTPPERRTTGRCRKQMSNKFFFIF